MLGGNDPSLVCASDLLGVYSVSGLRDLHPELHLIQYLLNNLR